MDKFIPDIAAPTVDRSAEDQARRETAAAYARLFSTPDGTTVLDDMRRKFGHNRPRYQRTAPTFDPIRAALIDGECCVIREIEDAIRHGGGRC